MIRLRVSLFVILAGARVHAQPAPPMAQPPSPTSPDHAQPPAPADEKPADAKPADEKPADEKPADKKPADAKSTGVPLQLSYDKAIVMATADRAFQARLSLRTQIRLEVARPTEDGAEFQNRFTLARARLSLDGNAFGAGHRYKLDLGLGERGAYTAIKDLLIEKDLGGVWLRAGQWKRPFNRQEIDSDFVQTFADRASAASYVGGGRDVGVALHNDFEKSPAGVEWVLGVFNGFSGASDTPSVPATCVAGTTAPTCTIGQPTTVPSDWGPTIVARLGWNSPNMKGYSEADLEGGPLRYAAAVSYKIDLANFTRDETTSRVDNLSHGLEVDAAIKAHGFDLSAAGYMMKIKTASATYGAMLQAGYFITPKHGQVAARFAVSPTSAASSARKQLEARLAYIWYWEGHRWKWLNELGWVKLTGTDPKTMVDDKPDYQFRSMAQLTF